VRNARLSPSNSARHPFCASKWERASSRDEISQPRSCTSGYHLKATSKEVWSWSQSLGGAVAGPGQRDI
jgi:hypothetical protein